MAKIAIASIKAPTWNSRVTDAEKDKSEHAEIVSLAAAMKSSGQLQPIEVEGPDTDGGYILVFGTRRKAAAKLNGWTEIEATIYPISTPAQRMVRNGMENLKRKNLTTFEEARTFSEMRKAGLKNEEIGANFGVSMQKVSNLASRFEKLPEPILAEWKASNPVATDEFLAELQSDKTYPTAEKKMQRWDERAAEVAESEKDGKKAGKRGKGKDKNGDGSGSAGFPVSQKRLGHIINALSNKKGSPDLADDLRVWARALIGFVIQGRETPPTGIPPLPPKPKKEKAETEK
jgi:ParB/RepB/Spo0J family partition protein